ncbi:hypothetical protein GCM10022255_105840 [Dactylosporangium darangshiense]|uniref:PH domain-containing protein n=1 Tax=Dactylosporangium darangshiense TaxID=579108 RepID=A0ABP8DTE3_9ACTN
MRGRGWWLFLAAAVPVGLPLAGRWRAALAFAGLAAAAIGPLFLAQWWARRRQRAEHAAGSQRWHGHLPLPRAAVIWELGAGLALLFGGGVPVTLTAGADGLTLGPRRPVSRRHPPLTVLWRDIAAVHAEPAGRFTDWGRVAVMPLTAVVLDLPEGSGGPLVVTTHDAEGLVDSVAAHKLADPAQHRG